jgi:hypothetical protein
MGQGRDFLIGGGFGVIRGWMVYHERYHIFHVSPIHIHVSLATYGLGFWFVGYLLPPPPGGPLLGSLLSPMLKEPPPLLLIGTVHPIVNNLLASPIRDGLPPSVMVRFFDRNDSWHPSIVFFF